MTTQIINRQRPLSCALSPACTDQAPQLQIVARRLDGADDERRTGRQGHHRTFANSCCRRTKSDIASDRACSSVPICSCASKERARSNRC
jgi:hypothetical protein